MEIDKQQILSRFTQRTQAEAPRSEFDDLIRRIIVMTGGHTINDYGKWCGRTKHLSHSKLKMIVLNAENNGEPQGRLFNYLLKQSRG